MRIRKALLPTFIVVLLGVSMAPAEAAGEIVISIDTIVRSQEGVVTVLETVAVDPALIGATCSATAEGANQTSVHPNNDLLIDTGGTQALLDDVEQTIGKITPASNDVVLGSTITISLIMGRDRVFSGGFIITFDCDPVPPTTTTTSTTSTTTTTTTMPPTTTTTTTMPPTTTTTTSTSTTTTVPPTTTTSTVPPTTTTSTVPPTTTTSTVPPTTTTSTVPPTTTTIPVVVLPTTITAPPTTTSTPPPDSTTTAPAATVTTAPVETLPVTGLATDTMLPLGLALLGLGLVVESLFGRIRA